jgi:glycosyltransferase involved in cell wall biosynthesis
MAPGVSVYTAAHETGAAIEIPFRSLLAQSSADWEWVVIDDSPGPDTTAHLARLAGSDAAAGRVKLHRRETAGSVGASKAAAAALCGGEILVELDHDDELLPEALDTVARAFRSHPEVDFVYSDWIDVAGTADALYPPGWAYGFGAYAHERVAGRRRAVALAPPVTWETIRHIVSTPNHLRAWRAGFYHRIGGHDPALAVGDDYELLVRTFLGGSMARIPRPLYTQHHDPGGANTSRRRNPEIQERVAEVSARHERAIDERCLSLGAIPNAPSPSTCAERIHAASVLIDPIADEAAARGEPLVSVVMPTYARPEPLARAVESALAQTYPNLELLVVGDGCPEIDAVAGAFDDPRIRSWNLDQHHDDHGAAPRNHALKTMARGTLIAYLDDDNTWLPNHLGSLVELLTAEPARAFAFSSYETLGEQITCRRPRRFQIDTSALLHRRELLDRYGYWSPDAETGWAHDWELVSRWEDESWAASLLPTLRYTLADDDRGRAVLRAMRETASAEIPA